MSNLLTTVVVLAISAVALAGCSSAPSVTVEQNGLSSASGKDSKTLDCSSGKGSIAYTTTGTAGKIHISLKDQADGKIIDKDDVSGSASGTLADLRGAAGTWTLTVERSSFSGSYSVRLTC